MCIESSSRWEEPDDEIYYRDLTHLEGAIYNFFVEHQPKFPTTFKQEHLYLHVRLPNGKKVTLKEITLGKGKVFKFAAVPIKQSLKANLQGGEMSVTQAIEEFLEENKGRLNAQAKRQLVDTIEDILKSR